MPPFYYNLPACVKRFLGIAKNFFRGRVKASGVL